VTVSADFVVLTDGTNYKTLAISGTLDFGVNGAVNRLDAGSAASATWYAVWAIAKSDGTQGTLASTSATSPTLPSGYTFKARLGWVRTAAASSDLLGTWQYGRRVAYVQGLAGTSSIPVMQSGATGNPTTGPTLTAVAVGNFVPSTASCIDIALYAAHVNGTGNTFMSAGPNNSYGVTSSTTNPPPLAYTGGGGGAATVTQGGTFRTLMMLESTNVYCAMSPASGTALLLCFGWEDNI